jgi:preprotein translocase subunit YajC
MGAMSPILMMLLMFGVFYFILIRPQVKRQREQQEMLKKLDKGETIITRGGVIGKITGSNGDILVVEIQEKVRVRIPRAYVEARWDDAQGRPADVVAPGRNAA